MTLLTSLMEPKRLGLLRELAPSASVFGGLVNPGFAPAARQREQIEEAARSIGQSLVMVTASNDQTLEAAFATIVRERVGALLVAADPFFDTRRDRIITFSAQQRLPTIYQFREYAVAGGLLSYGVDVTEAYRVFGTYTARILSGAKPADLPVQQATKFELVINLRTARALAITISDNLLSLADEVIE
jgi:putative ABC transport system substrate-binding protein